MVAPESVQKMKEGFRNGKLISNLPFIAHNFELETSDCTDYGPVSISFGIACAATSLSVVYTAWNGWKTLKNDTNKSIEELTTESFASKKSEEF